MFILLLFINIFFTLVFFILWKKIESIFFVLVWIFIFFYFNPYLFKKSDKEEDNQEKKEIKINTKEYIKFFLLNIRKYSFYVAFLLFYLSIFGICFTLKINYSLIIFSLNFVIISIFYYFFKQKKDIIYLIFRSNFIIFSIFYLILFPIFLFTKPNLDFLFYINSIISVSWIVCIIIFDKFIDYTTKSRFYSFFLSYLIISVLFYLRQLFNLNYSIFVTYFFFIFSIIYFFIFPRIIYFQKFNLISKFSWVILNYFSIVFSIIFLFWFNDLFYIFLILFWVWFNYIIYSKFCNYFSLFFLLVSIIFVYIKLFLWLYSNNYLLVLLFSYLLPFLLFWYTYLFKKKHNLEYYFMQYTWITFSIISILFSFILFRNFSILNFSLFFLLESVLIFLSYLKLKIKSKNV